MNRNKQILSAVVATALLTNTAFAGEVIRVPYPETQDPKVIVNSDPDIYRYTHFNIDTEKKHIIYHEDMPTQADVNWVLKRLKGRTISDLNEFFKTNLYYAKEATVANSKLSTLLTKKSGLCRPITVLYSECATQLGYGNQLAITNTSDNRHIVVLFPNKITGKQEITDIASLVRYKGDTGKYTNQDYSYLARSQQTPAFEMDFYGVVGYEVK